MVDPRPGALRWQLVRNGEAEVQLKISERGPGRGAPRGQKPSLAVSSLPVLSESISSPSGPAQKPETGMERRQAQLGFTQ